MSSPFRLRAVWRALACACCAALLCVRVFAIPTPTPLAPAHNLLGYVPQPNFTWSDVPDAVSYDIQVSSSTTFSPLVVNDSVDIPRYVPKAPLFTANRFWRVRATDAAGNQSPWSATFTYQLRAPSVTVNVPDGATLAEIRSHLATAIASRPATLLFKAGGTYAVNPADSHVLSVANAQDLIIDGNDATFVISNPSAGFAKLSNCQRVVVRRLKIDYNPLPHSVGVVEGVNATTGLLTVRRLPGYPDFDAPHMIANWSWGCLLDKNNRGRLKPAANLLFNFDKTSVVQSATDADVFTFKLVTAGYASQFALDDRLIVFARENGKELCGVDKNCRDVTFDRLTNYASPAGHYSLIDTSEAKILDCHSRKKDTTRWFAGNADGVHSRANLVGPWIEGCSFEGTGDDGVALYNKGIAVVAQDTVNWNKVTVLGDVLMNLQAGHVFRVFNPRDGTLIGGSFTVQSVTANGANHDITFTPALTTALASNAADRTQADQLFNVSRRNASFMIRGNTFDGVRRYGTIIRSANGVVRGNTYRGCSSSAVVMLNEPVQWFNGLYSLNNLIAANTTESCGFDNSAGGMGDIHVVFRKLTGNSGARPHDGILIEGNTLKNWSQRGISLENATNSTILNNVFVSTQTGFALPGQNHGIYVNATTGTLVSGNDFSGETRPLTAQTTITANNN